MSGKLEKIQKVAKRVHKATVSLACDLGVYHGINDTLGKQSLHGPTTHALDTMRQALILSIAMLIRALYNRGNCDDDASFYVLKRFGQNSAIIDALSIKKTAIYAVSIHDDNYREKVESRCQSAVDEFLAELRNINAERHERIKFFCDKMFAHLTIVTDIEKPLLQDLWAMSEEATSGPHLTIESG